MGTSSARKKAKEEATKKELQKFGVEEIKVYFHAIPILGNVYTACLFLDKDRNIISRGISICSPLDTFKKSEGRNRSYKRAMRALHAKKNNLPINAYMQRWDDRYINRTYKAKTFEDETLFFDRVQPILHMAGVDDKISINSFFRKITLPGGTRKNVEQKRIMYKLPKDIMLYLTSEVFDYKSHYKPEATKDEAMILTRKE